jgi:hypothetical protein
LYHWRTWSFNEVWEKYILIFKESFVSIFKVCCFDVFTILSLLDLGSETSFK